MDEVVASQKFRLDSGASWELQGFDPWKNENLLTCCAIYEIV